MNNLYNRHLIAIIISMAIHGLVLFLLSYSFPVITQSHSEGQKAVISIQMSLVSATAKEMIVADSAETVAPHIVNDHALIKAPIRRPSPQKEEIKPKPALRKPARKAENKKEIIPIEPTKEVSTHVAGNVNALEGTHSPSPLEGTSRGETVSKSSYLSRLLTSIEKHKQYPPDARRTEGKSIVTFRLADNGDIYDVSIRKSSGYSVLDAAAVSAVKQGGLTLPPPADVPRSMNVTVTFSLH